MVSWYATEYWSAGELVSSFFKWANTDSWTVSSETPNFDATYMEIKVYFYWMTSIKCTILTAGLELTSLHASWFIISLFGSSPGSGNKSFGKSTLKYDYHCIMTSEKTYLEPWMLYDITDGRSFHCIDLEHLSNQVRYWRILYMFWCFVNSSFDL